jgi:hypothetical protein
MKCVSQLSIRSFFRAGRFPLAIGALSAVFFHSVAYAKPVKCLNEKKLSEILRSAIRSVDFDQIVDLGPTFAADPCPTTEPACKHGRSAIGKSRFPQIDLAVIAFQGSCKKKVVGSNVLFSRDFPHGLIAKFDKKTAAVSNIRLQRWTQERFDEGQVIKTAPYFVRTPNAWKKPFPADDRLNAEASHAAVDFMSPYPASIFKMLVLTKVLTHLESQGPLESQLEQKYTYDFGTPDPADDVTNTLREYLDAMIQWSGNKATAAMIQFLHRNGLIVESQIKDEAGYPAAAPSVNKLNDLFAAFGLHTLQMNRTRSKDGLWGNRDAMYLKDSSSISHISMPSWDVARFLWIMRSQHNTPHAELPKWLAANGQRVDPFSISDDVKQKFWANLGDQFFHEVLSNALHCKQDKGGAFGIPARLPLKWMNQDQLQRPVDGYPFVFTPDELKGDYKFSTKISECQKLAEVEFASKTGLTSVSGSHAGWVKGLSDRGFKREYIVVLNSSLGSRFTDAERLDSDRVIPCFNKTQCYSKRINELGERIDAALKGWLDNNERNDTALQPSERQTKGQ